MNAVTYLSQNTHYISKLSHYFGLSHKPIAFPHMFPTRKEYLGLKLSHPLSRQASFQQLTTRDKFFILL